MFKIKKNNIFLIRGDSFIADLDLKNPDGEPYEFTTDDEVTFTVKENTDTRKIVIQKTITDGRIVVDPTDTEHLPYGDYVYDVQLRHISDGYTDTVIPPRLFRLTEEVTF